MEKKGKNTHEEEKIKGNNWMAEKKRLFTSGERSRCSQVNDEIGAYRHMTILQNTTT
jgi:hypothetical protein